MAKPTMTKLIIILALAMLAVSAFSPMARALEDDIVIYERDNYSKSVEMDETVTYFWGIYNKNSSTHIIFVDVSPGVNGWNAELPNAYFEVGEDDMAWVELEVTAPNTRDYPFQTFYVTVNITDLVNETSWTIELEPCVSEIVGGAYVPPTKALGFVPNYFADPLGIEALDNEWGVFLLSITLWIIIGAIIYFVLDPVVKHFTKSTKTEIDDQILAIVKGPVFGLIILWGLVSSLRVLDLSWNIIHGVEMVYSILVIILVSWMTFKILKDVLLIWGKAYSEKTDTTLDDIMLPLFEKLGQVVIIIIAIIAILNVFGVDVTMLVAGMGVMGLVIAFAAQDTLGNFISGMFLLTDRPFKVGDLVLMENGDYCRVEHIGMRSTKLYNTFDHDVIVLPNSKIANEKVINLTEPDNNMKIRVEVGVAYDADINKAEQIMLEVTRNNSAVMKEEGKAPFVRMTAFGDSAINLKVYAWVYHLDDQWRVAHEIRHAVFERFKAEGIDIPFPQRVVHMQGYGDNEPSITG